MDFLHIFHSQISLVAYSDTNQFANSFFCLAEPSWPFPNGPPCFTAWVFFCLGVRPVVRSSWALPILRTPCIKPLPMGIPAQPGSALALLLDLEALGLLSVGIDQIGFPYFRVSPCRAEPTISMPQGQSSRIYLPWLCLKYFMIIGVISILAIRIKWLCLQHHEKCHAFLKFCFFSLVFGLKYVNFAPSPFFQRVFLVNNSFFVPTLIYNSKPIVIKNRKLFYHKVIYYWIFYFFRTFPYFLED